MLRDFVLLNTSYLFHFEILVGIIHICVSLFWSVCWLSTCTYYDNFDAQFDWSTYILGQKGGWKGQRYQGNVGGRDGGQG